MCRKRQSLLGLGQPKSWACGIVYVLGRVNFLDDPSFSPHMKTTELCQGASYREGFGRQFARSAMDGAQPHRTQPPDMDGRGRRFHSRFACHAPRCPGTGVRCGFASLYPGRSEGLTKRRTNCSALWLRRSARVTPSSTSISRAGTEWACDAVDRDLPPSGDVAFGSYADLPCRPQPQAPSSR